MEDMIGPVGNQDDWRKLGQLSRALRPHEASWEALSEIAVGLASRRRGGGFGRVAQLLYRRTEREHSPSPPIGSIFFRLSLDGRLALVALKARALDYAGIGQVLGIPAAEVEKLAWKCRVALGGEAAYPSGSARRSANCPDYDPSAPWTQAYLDHSGQTTRAERFFLETHLRECDDCRATLSRARAVISRADAEIDRAAPEPGQDARELRDIQAMLKSLDTERPRPRWISTPEGSRTIFIALVILVVILAWSSSQ